MNFDLKSLDVKNTVVGVLRYRAVRIALIALAAFAVTAGGLKIHLSIRFPESKVREYISGFMLKNFSKAVKFDDASISFTGNVILSNFYLSNSSDFNDNINLIKSRRVEVRAGWLSALAGRLVIRGIVIEDPEITIVKKYGKSYLDVFREIFTLNRPMSEISEIDSEHFYVLLDDSSVSYNESFIDSAMEIEFEDMDAALSFSGSVMRYSAAGAVKKCKSGIMGRGRISLSGEVLLSPANSVQCSSNFLVLKNVDLSCINDMLEQGLQQPFLLGGGLTASVRINTRENNLSVSGGVELDNLTLKYNSGAKSFNVASNENLRVEALVDSLDGGGRILVKRLVVFDDSMRLELKGARVSNRFEDVLDVSFKTNRVNLADLSETVTPVRDAVMKGFFAMDGRVWYDFKHGNAEEVRCLLTLSDFSMDKQEKTGPSPLFREVNMSADLRSDTLKVRLSGKKKNSDIDVAAESVIHGWFPFRSDTSLSVTSGRMDLSYLLESAAAIVEALYSGAESDRSIGYEQIDFRNEPLGLLLNNNNVACAVKIAEVEHGKAARLKNLAFSAGLDRGHMFLKDFALEGYGGAYELEYDGHFEYYQPQIRLKGGVKDFDLKAFHADADSGGEVGGVFSADFNYQFSGARLSHILMTSMLDVSASVKNGIVKNTHFQGELAEYFVRNGLSGADIASIAFSDFSVSFYQRAESFVVSRLSLGGDALAFSGRGKYMLEEGLDVAVPVAVKVSTEEGVAKTEKAPLVVRGALKKPYLAFEKNPAGKNGGESKFLLFHLD